MGRVFSVSQFISAINDIVAGQFTVEGEVAGYSVSQGKWAFFSLKDESSVLNCFAAAFRLPFPLEDGMQVRVTGYARIYERSGKFSLVVEYLELIGEGAAQRAYEILKKKLLSEGLFAADRKRLLPQWPERIGVITSRDAAAWGDFKRIAANRWGGVEIVLRHSAVQGIGAVEDIVSAFYDLAQAGEACDALVLIRGGGSMEDLAAFNSEAVVRAVYASPIPVLVGVGHERDETLADLAADVRASTPSNAAEILLPDRKEFIRDLANFVEFMDTRLEYARSRQQHETEQLGRQLAVSCDALLTQVHNAIDDFSLLLRSIEAHCAHQGQSITASEQLLASLSPQRVLERGYSITRRSDGTLARNASAIDKGEILVIELQHGQVNAEAI